LPSPTQFEDTVMNPLDSVKTAIGWSWVRESSRARDMLPQIRPYLMSRLRYLHPPCRQIQQLSVSHSLTHSLSLVLFVKLSLSFSFLLPLCYSLSNTHTYTHIHMHKHIHTHTVTHIHAHSVTHAHTRTRTHAHRPPYTRLTPHRGQEGYEVKGLDM